MPDSQERKVIGVAGWNVRVPESGRGGWRLTAARNITETTSGER